MKYLALLLVLALPARAETWSAIMYPDDAGAPTKVVATKPTLPDCEDYIDDQVKYANEKFQLAYKDKDAPAMDDALKVVKLLTRRTVCLRDQLKPVVPPSSRGPTTRVAPSATGSESGHKVCEDCLKPVAPPFPRGPTTRVAPSATGSESGHKVCEAAQQRLTQANSVKNLNDAADIIAKWPFHCDDPKSP